MCIIGLIASVIVGLVPAIAYAGFVIWLDRHEREPWWLLLLSFMWGAIPGVIIALIAQTLLDIPTTWVLAQASLAYEIVGSSLWAPITEEIAKGLGVILIMVLAHREIDSILDGIIYGALAGLGFAFTEDRPEPCPFHRADRSGRGGCLPQQKDVDSTPCPCGRLGGRDGFSQHPQPGGIACRRELCPHLCRLSL
jgi:hypothetical protein